MSDSGGMDRPTETVREAGQSMYQTVIDIVLTGLTIIFPIIVTVYVIKVGLNMLGNALSPLVSLLTYLGVIGWIKHQGVYLFLSKIPTINAVYTFLSSIIAFLLLVVVVLVFGAVAHLRYGNRVIDFFDFVVGAIPGIGTVYQSFRRMGDAMLQSDIENFRSVKLVEFPHEGSYVIGFETARPPKSIRETVGSDDMVTMFVPLAPNPVMGGFLTHMPTDQVHDLDMSVEEGVRSIITSGIATQETDRTAARDDGLNVSAMNVSATNLSPNSFPGSVQPFQVAPETDESS